MSVKSRVAAYVGAGVLLLVLFDPRTWGGEVDAGGGDEVGVVLAAQLALSLAGALAVLTAVIVLVETAIRARRRRRSGQVRSPERDEGAGRR